MADHFLDRSIALIKEVRQLGRTAIHPQGQLGEIVRANRKSIKALGKLLGQHHIGRDFRHHVHMQAVFASYQVMFGHHGEHAVGLLQGATEGNHDDDIGQSDLVPDFLHRPAFQGKAGAVALAVVAHCTSEAQHRVFLGRFEILAAYQVGILIGLKIAHAHDHRLGVMRRGNFGDTSRQMVDKIHCFVLVATGQLLDLPGVRLFP